MSLRSVGELLTKFITIVHSKIWTSRVSAGVCVQRVLQLLLRHIAKEGEVQKHAGFTNFDFDSIFNDSSDQLFSCDAKDIQKVDGKRTVCDFTRDEVIFF